jgi:nitroreductase
MLDVLLNHKSVRKYKNTPISDEILNKILKSAIRGSNTGNMQIYSIVVTKDQNIKEKLLPAHFNQIMVSQAPIVLTFCADINRFNLWCKQRNAKPDYDNFLWLYNATIDAVIASQNACLAAESFGLGICYLGTTTYMAEKIIEILQLPIGVVPVTTIVIGYPEVIPELTDRLPLDAVIHYDTYKNYSSEEIDRLHKEKEELEFTKKLVIENNTENLAQIFTEKRYKKADNLHFSNEFLKVIKKQGFMNNE